MLCLQLHLGSAERVVRTLQIVVTVLQFVSGLTESLIRVEELAVFGLHLVHSFSDRKVGILKVTVSCIYVIRGSLHVATLCL